MIYTYKDHIHVRTNTTCPTSIAIRDPGALARPLLTYARDSSSHGPGSVQGLMRRRDCLKGGTAHVGMSIECPLSNRQISYFPNF